MKKITKARSHSNGIIFFSNIKPEYATDTFLDKNGEVRTYPIPTELADSPDYDDSAYEPSCLKLWMLIAFDGLLILSGILLAIFFGYFNAIWASIYFSIFASYNIFGLIYACFCNKYQDEHNHSIAKFHGAEHMAINAYDKLKHIPTLEEIKRFSRFSKHCGSMQVINKTVMFVLISVNMLVPSIISLLILLFVFLFMEIACFTGLFRFLQVFFVSKPTDAELLLAIQGLKEFERMEVLLEKIKNLEDKKLHNS